MKTVLLVLSLSLVLASTCAAEEALPLQFDSSVLNFGEFKLDATQGRYQGPDGQIVRVVRDKMKEAEAKKVLKNRLVQLKLLFAPQTAPYPGMLTKDETCAATAKFAKKTTSTPEAEYWFSEMPATEGLIYGTCGSMDEPYWSQQLLIYCRKQGVFYDVRYFKPKAKSSTKVGKPVASCKP